MMKVIVENGLFTAYGVGAQGAIAISHLQFAGDTLLLWVKSWVNIRIIKVILILFEVVFSCLG